MTRSVLQRWKRKFLVPSLSARCHWLSAGGGKDDRRIATHRREIGNKLFLMGPAQFFPLIMCILFFHFNSGSKILFFDRVLWSAKNVKYKREEKMPSGSKRWKVKKYRKQSKKEGSLKKGRGKYDCPLQTRAFPIYRSKCTFTTLPRSFPSGRNLDLLENHNIAEVYAELAFFTILDILCWDNAAKDRPVCDLKPLDVTPTSIYRCHR